MSTDDDEKIEKFEKSLKDGMLSGSSRQMLVGLTAREAKIFRIRFGINIGENISLENVGKKFDVTKERIRKIEKEFLSK